jgi:hypothetical protein
MWWAAATVNMVGYGEIYPIEYGGRIIGAISSFLGLLCMAFPLIVVGSSFKESIVRIMYRQNTTSNTKHEGDGVKVLLEEMNKIIGENMFTQDDELVFLANKLNSKEKVQQMLSLQDGWGGLPFAPDQLTDRPRISQFKLYVIYELYGRRFRCVKKARKRYRRAFKCKLRRAIKRSLIRKRKKQKIEVNFEFKEDVPLTVIWKPVRMPSREHLEETSENEVYVFSESSSRENETDIISKAKDTSKADGLKVVKPAILHENLGISELATAPDNISREDSSSLVIKNGSNESPKEDGFAV